MVKSLTGEPFPDEYIIFLFDDILSILDSRMSGETKNQVISFFINQVRKRRSHLIGTSTDVMHGDIRFRNEVKFLMECSKREAEDFFEYIHGDYSQSYDYYRELADKMCWVECDDAECPNRHVFNYEVWKIKKSTKEMVNDYWIFNTQELYDGYESWDISPPIENMSQSRISSVMSKITNLGQMRPSFIIHLPIQMREDSTEFQEMIYRPFSQIKTVNMGLDFEFKSNSTGLIDSVIWRGKMKDADRKTIDDLVSKIQPEKLPEKLLEKDSRWKSFFTEP